MKKIIFSTMIACLLAFVGCQNEELVNENTNNGGEKVILTANIQGATDSRVVLTPATDDKSKPIVKVAWNESEETFEVYGSSGASSTFTQIAGTNQFVGTLPEPDNGGYEAYYGDPSSLVEQDGKLGQSTANDSPVLMSAMFDSSSPSITFEHVTAILKPTFKVNGTDINNTITNINNTITKIVMGDVAFALDGTPEYRKITIAPTSPAITLADVIYIHLPIMINYTGDTFIFTVTADGKNYTGSLTIPTGKSIEAGKFYTADIALTENACELPDGNIFRTAVHSQMTNDTRAIKFIANSDVVTEYQIGTSPAYMKLSGTTLEIHTAAKEFVFNADCSTMFSGLNSYKFAKLTAIDFNDCINTSKVTNMQSMFKTCRDLTSLDLSKFNTSKVTNMESMFYYCPAFTSLDLSKFNTANVTNMQFMFYSCYTLTSLDLSNFNTANVENMSNMFCECSDLTSLDIRNFDIGKVTDFEGMFSQVGYSYYYQTAGRPKTQIKVTTALNDALVGNSVSPGNYAVYDIID